ncbi:ATP-dependent transcriptional regulator [Sanguibacter keddieii DSM 10542]|uniref:ATP-dependent transcriptional regulator n=1 Tax=Sanguibacter keddieii (strain ATCC 51767 / DSM 10542 / NCFB 3025 / ST-74) TaxID=446469 RepID=D1BBT2_SANKS|nr:LuxR C-terminal-related transcriptional regulator [Sanguibacter keddieii]ACZ22853.1 ATP-dependent transcriptional regulator [Sanguibacter keddieii DSM 10542]
MSGDSERHAGARDGARPARLPRAPSVLVAKPTLTALLDRHEPLTVLRAPKGYGKTALVSGWARGRAAHVDLVWVSCRLPSVLSDGMPAPFWARLADEMWRSGLGVVEPGLAPGRSDVVAALAGRSDPLCVVVDDFDDNTDPHVAGELLDLVSRFDTLDVVVLARSPRTADALLASTVDSVELGPQDLLLSVDDAAGLVSALGHELTPDQVHRLVRDTGGWPALLRAVLAGSVSASRTEGRVRSAALGAAADDLQAAVTGGFSGRLPPAAPGAAALPGLVFPAQTTGGPPARRPSSRSPSSRSPSSRDLPPGGPSPARTSPAGPGARVDRAVLHSVVSPVAEVTVDLTAGFAYLRAVWDELDDQGMRRFVQHTGLLGAFTVDDAVASSGLRDSARHVGALLDLGLLVQDTDEDDARFRYVEAVRLAAAEIFRSEEPRRFRVAQRRLARLRTSQGRVDEAVGHLLAARTWEACAELVDLHWATLVAERPEVVADVVETVPEEVLARHPRLGVARAHLLPVLRPQRRRTSGSGAPVDGALHDVGPRATHPEEGLAQVLGSMEEGLGQIVTLRLTGDFGAATTLAERAQDGLGPLLDTADTAAKGELAPLLYEWAVTRLLGADVEGALAAFRQGAELARSVDRPVVLREAAVGAALCCALLGYLEQAEEWLLEVPPGVPVEDAPIQEGRGVRTVRSIVALERFEPAGPEQTVLLGDLGAASGLGVVVVAVRAQAALRDGTHYEVLAEVEEAREHLQGTTATKSLREALLAGAAVDLYLGLGYVSKARAAVAGIDHGYEVVGLACARTDLVAGDLEDAVTRASALLATRVAGPRLRLDLLLVLAAAQAGLGHRHEAAVALEEATSICRATGLLRSFLKVPREVLEDLAPLVPGVRAVLEAPGFAEAVGVFPSEPPRARLSSRELQVLRSLAESPSLASVARSLFLSSNTVKTHLRSIYQKLGTHSSVETVEKARDLGLLDDDVAVEGEGDERDGGER